MTLHYLDTDNEYTLLWWSVWVKIKPERELAQMFKYLVRSNPMAWISA